MVGHAGLHSSFESLQSTSVECTVRLIREFMLTVVLQRSLVKLTCVNDEYLLSEHPLSFSHLLD